MIEKKQLYHYLFSLLLLAGIASPATTSMAAQEGIEPAQGHHKSYTQTARDYWKQWYNFRQKYVYPTENFVRLVTAGDYDTKSNPRRHFPDIFETGHPTLAPRFFIGIVDAALAQKPAEEIVRDDVVHFASYVGCLFAFDYAIASMARRLDANLLFAEQFAPHFLNIMPQQIRDNLNAVKTLAAIAAYYYKHKIVGLASCVVGKPTGYIAYKAVKTFKNRRNRVLLKNLPKVTIPVL